MYFRTWPAKDADNLARAAAIVGNGNHIAERRLVGAAQVLKDVDEAVGGASAREDDDAGPGVGGGGWRCGDG